MQLDGRIAVVTGAGSGIGRALAVALARQGMRLALVGRRAAALEETRAALRDPDKAVVLSADLTRAADRGRLVQSLAAAFGRVDLLVNNAGMVISGPVTSLDDEAARQMMETNLLAPLALTRDLLPLLRRSSEARLVNIGSMFGDIAFPLFSAYSASKFAVRGLSDALRRELEPQGIAVTYVAPRGTRTPAAEGFADLVGPFKMRLDPPEKVADLVIGGLRRNARVIYPRGQERLFLLIQHLFPGLIDGALRKQAAAALPVMEKRT